MVAINVEEVIEIHTKLIKKFGGLAGIKNIHSIGVFVKN